MVLYSLFVIFCILGIRVFDVNRQKQGKLFFLFIAWLFLVLIVGFQNGMGGDNLQYEEAYDTYLPLNQLDFTSLLIGGRYQPLWYIFIATLKMFNDSFTFFHIVHAIIINTAVVLFFKRYTKFLFSAILLYFVTLTYFYFNLEIQRESLAIACMLFSFPLLEKKKFILYYIICFIAFFIHVSSIFLWFIPIVLFLFDKCKTTKAQVRLSLVLSIVLCLFFSSFAGLFQGSGDVAGELMNQADTYSSGQQNSLHQLIIGLFKIIPIAILLYVRKKEGIGNDIFVKFTILLIIIFIANAYIRGLYRLGNYITIPYYVFIVDSLMNKQIKKHYKGIGIIIIILIMIPIIWQHLAPLDQGRLMYQMYFPYRSIFD